MGCNIEGIVGLFLLLGQMQLTGSEKVYSYPCGNIKIENPDQLFYGRNVTIHFLPNQTFTQFNATPTIWNINAIFMDHLHTSDNETNVHKFVLINYPNSLLHNDFFIKYGSCNTQTFRLHLKGSEKVYSYPCGNIKIENPDQLFYGRNVTIHFLPNQTFTQFNATPTIWNINAIFMDHLHTSDNETNVHKFVLINYPNSLLHNDFFIKYGSCNTQTFRLHLKELTDCGHLYMRTPCVLVGSHAELVFIPAPALVGFNSNYVLYWLETSSASNERRIYPGTEKLYKQRNESDSTYVLMISNIAKAMDGNTYRVQCTDKLHQFVFGNKYTDPITINVFQTPDAPVLGPLHDLDDCKGCLLLHSNNTSRKIYCKTLETNRTNVSMKINGRVCTNIERTGEMYIPIVDMVTDKDHLTNVSCSVINCAMKEPLVVSAQLYVANDTTTEIQHVNVTNVKDQTQSSKTVTEKSNLLTTTKSAYDRHSGSTTKELLSTTQRIIQTSSPSEALKTTDTSVLTPSASNGGFQNVIIPVACALSAVIIVIAIVLAVVCVKLKRRSVANAPLQDMPRVEQVSQKEEGHDVISVHYEFVPEDNTERGASTMYTSLQTNQQVAEIHLYTGLRESSLLSKETSTYYSVAEQGNDVPGETNTHSNDKTYYNVAANTIHI
ncbi:uncharacterized protein LOC127852237 isoform X1 [Dreissena polymorpha]|uniref:uncharacterized protein LOC127852237 isoform X1 n=1 Tax=Dreissena polymorpha TaxID=45954 RepID=UPI0022643462|nr:uncharacterized protein LOC127852237 isoform X1 [Dreissena polymorpha]